MLAGELLQAALLLLLLATAHASILRSLAPEQRESTSRKLRKTSDGSLYASMDADVLPASLKSERSLNSGLER
jgi:hypothetical protein